MNDIVYSCCKLAPTHTHKAQQHMCTIFTHTHAVELGPVSISFVCVRVRSDARRGTSRFGYACRTTSTMAAAARPSHYSSCVHVWLTMCIYRRCNVRSRHAYAPCSLVKFTVVVMRSLRKHTRTKHTSHKRSVSYFIGRWSRTSKNTANTGHLYVVVVVTASRH